MKKNGLKISVILLLAVILGISIGYAAYSTLLNISSVTTINRSIFSVHYDKDSVNVLTGTDNGYNLVNPSSGPVFSSDNKKLSFNTTLNLNEETRFTVNVVNDGTIRARVSDISLSISSKLENETNYNSIINTETNRWGNKYLDFYVVWTDGEKNILDTVDIEAGTSKNMTIVIRYKEPEDYNDLPGDNLDFKFEMDINYIQSNFRKENEAINPLLSTSVGSSVDFINTIENNQNSDLIIELTDDIDLTSQENIALVNNTTIELNGHNLLVAPNSIGVYSDAVVVIEDSTNEGTISGDRGLFNVYNGGKLIINSGNFITTNNSRGSGIYMEDGGTLIVNGGKFNTAYYVIGSEGNVDITINGGHLESTSTSKNGTWAYAVKLVEGKFTMNGGSIIGIQGALALDGDVEGVINNGQINVNESSVGANDGYYCMYVTGTSKLDVNGGIFKNNGTRSVIYTSSTNNIDLYNGTFVAKGSTLFTGNNINVLGGYYSHDVSNYSDSNLQLDSNTNYYKLV